MLVKDLYVEMTMKTGGRIKIKLYPGKAPNSVSGFIEAVSLKLFDGLSIQRIVPDFVLQPWYDNSLMPKPYQYRVQGEFEENGFLLNDIRMKKYTVALAGDGKSFSEPGCFFIVAGDHCEKRLQGKFTAIGEVTEGFDEVDRLLQIKLEKVDTGKGVTVYRPVKEEIIANVRCMDNDIDLPPCKKFLPGK